MSSELCDHERWMYGLGLQGMHRSYGAMVTPGRASGLNMSSKRCESSAFRIQGLSVSSKLCELERQTVTYL